MQLPDHSNAELNWPKYALLTLAIEFCLKAFALYSAKNGIEPDKEPGEHDLLAWYRLALHYGLADKPDVRRNVELLNELYSTTYTRSLRTTTPLLDASVIAVSTVDPLIVALAQSINPRGSS